MKHMPSLIQPLRQRGFVAVISLVFLVTVVFFVLVKSMELSGSKQQEAGEYIQGVQALALAESGRVAAIAGMTSAVNLDDTSFGNTCTSYGTGTPISLGTGIPGTYQFVKPSAVDPATLYPECRVRVKGNIGSASRTLETRFNLSSVVGTGDYGTGPTMALHNPYAVDAVAMFNLAWRRQGSDGDPNPPGGQASASVCTSQPCFQRWNLSSSSGLSAVGSLGTSLVVSPNATVTVAQTIDRARDYVEVGLILGGLAAGSPPTFTGAYAANIANNTGTTGNSNTNPANGTTVSGAATANGTATGWCNGIGTGADTLVFGVSGRAIDRSAQFSTVTFNTNGNPAQPVALNFIAHYPNLPPFPASPRTWGDIFTSIWYTYNQYASIPATSSTGATTTVNGNTVWIVNGNAPSNLAKDTILKVYSGTGVFAGNTRFVSRLSATQFTVDKAPTANLSGATICGGVCALFDQPASSSSTTQFQLLKNGNTDQQWAGGFACFSGVDSSKIKRISSSNISVNQWHEVLSTDPVP